MAEVGGGTGAGADEAASEDAGSLVDAAFGPVKKASETPAEAEANAEAAADCEAETGDVAAAEAKADREADSAAATAAEADAETAAGDAVAADRGAEVEAQTAWDGDTVSVDANPDIVVIEIIPDVESKAPAKVKAAKPGIVAKETISAADAEGLTAESSVASGTAGSEHPSVAPGSAPASAPAPKRLTKGRLAAAGSALVALVVAGVLVLSSGGTSPGATGQLAKSGPTVNPQANYPAAAEQSPFATGSKSSLTDDALRAAVPDCGACKLVTRGNGFSPDGDVLALFRTGVAVLGKPNFKLVVVSPDGKLVWSAPDGVQAVSAGVERITEDASGVFYLALPGEKSGQQLVMLTWKDGKVVDLGGLTQPKIANDAGVGVLPQATPGATATIISQTHDGVPDASTGGLIESQYQIQNGVTVLIGCRRHVGESGEWIPYKPDQHGCADYPPGPVGPSDDDDQ